MSRLRNISLFWFGITTLVVTPIHAEFKVDQGLPFHLADETVRQQVASLIEIGEWHFRTQNMEYAGCVRDRKTTIYQNRVVLSYEFCMEIKQQAGVWVSVSRVDGSVESSAGVPKGGIVFLWRHDQKELARLKKLIEVERKERSVELKSE